MAEDIADAPETQLKALAYGSGLFFFLVTAGMALYLFLDDSFMFTLTMATAFAGGVLATVLLKQVYGV